MASQTVTRWAPLAQKAEQQTGIPAATLLGLIEIESGGREGLTSSANAQGLTQFIPGTARQYGVDVRPGHAWSQILGAARYLRDLGFKDDPRKALASYNAGPGNYQAGLGYAGNVQTAARKYGNLRATPGPAAPGTDEPAAAPASDKQGDAWDDAGIFAPILRSIAKALVWIALILGGAALIGVGAARTFGATGDAT